MITQRVPTNNFNINQSQESQGYIIPSTTAPKSNYILAVEISIFKIYIILIFQYAAAPWGPLVREK